MRSRQSTQRLLSSYRHKHRISICLLGLAMFLALFAGCGKGKSSSKGSKKPKPLQACELLTKADAEAAIGGTVDEAQKSHKEYDDDKHWVSGCRYYSPEKEKTSIGLTILPHVSGGNAAEAFAFHDENLKKGLEESYDTEVVMVEGVGEYATWQKGGQLTVFQGPFTLMVIGYSPDMSWEDALEFCKQNAAKVLKKLPR